MGTHAVKLSVLDSREHRFSLIHILYYSVLKNKPYTHKVYVFFEDPSLYTSSCFYRLEIKTVVINIPKFICVHVHLAADIEKESSGVEEEEDLEPGTFEIPIFTEEFLDHNKGL